MADEESHQRRRNYLALLLRRTLAGFFNGLPMQYVNLYIVECGYSEVDLGAVRSVATLLAALPSSIVNLVADVSSRKRAYALALLLEMLSALLFYVSSNQLLLVLAVTFSLVSFFGATNVENVLLADSVRGRRRAFGFGVANSLSIVASATAPVVAAFIVNIFGGISVQGIRPLFLVQLAGLAFASAIALIFVSDVRELEKVSFSAALKESIELVRLNPWLKRWILLEILGGYVFSMSVPYQMIYAVDVKGADEFVLGYMGLAFNVGSFLASPLIGKLADKIGRVKTILLVRPLFYISLAIFLFAPNPAYLVLAWFIRGIWMASSSAFQTLVMELVPYEFRGRWASMRTLISITARSPAPLVGGLIYSYVSPDALFITAALVDMFLRVPLIYMTPETLNRKQYLDKLRRPRIN
ncbi:MAG: hypothetical protein DRJ55_05110 [Thermoprotei archaeon]|nr:MAG: hypothetical protein DRJ46_01830 [Thermoprotei archaeon]RLE91892.1 MAG: hypothetical protein DRJ55_05110 [Thermoprotei archaeon]